MPYRSPQSRYDTPPDMYIRAARTDRESSPLRYPRAGMYCFLQLLACGQRAKWLLHRAGGFSRSGALSSDEGASGGPTWRAMPSSPISHSPSGSSSNGGELAVAEPDQVAT